MWKFLIFTLLLISTKSDGRSDPRLPKSLMIKIEYDLKSIVINCNGYQNGNFIESIAERLKDVIAENESSITDIEFRGCPTPDKSYSQIRKHLTVQGYIEELTLYNIINPSQLKSAHFHNLEFIKELRILSITVDKLPSDLFVGMPHLYTLSMSIHKMKKLPAHIFKPLKKLDTLELILTRVIFLDDDVFKYLVNLVHLQISAPLCKLPAVVIGPLKSLKTVSIDSTQLEKLENIFVNVNKLIEVNIFKNPYLQTIPRTLFNNNPNITQINLSNNKLIYFAIEHIKELKQLESIDLKNNQISFRIKKTLNKYAKKNGINITLY